MSHAGIYESDKSFGNSGFCMIFPESTKNGIARRRNLLIPAYILVATMVREVPEYRIAQTEDSPRQIAMGTPMIGKNKK